MCIRTKKMNAHLRALYPAISFINKGEIKAFLDMQKLKELITSVCLERDFEGGSSGGRKIMLNGTLGA